ncbi:Histone-lysine N-methyltransferase setd3 [Hondaea fermentalgiana]|uniref:Histone-lysine N-methyltransferase setd3 n=1 Tax=Hondaea fermentalgiana TaxID=2315210 RepID=A0A2R5GEH5_9STRA|nr:Histone-lysine N-methyltransferase setd3 [Hondaea fermentalgiana]|eukprot:GBG29350.1 Histone-lysine N-methyltransferase setd3 [Hondaea fermentalgiana]
MDERVHDELNENFTQTSHRRHGPARASTEFLAWFEQNGGRATHVDLASFEDFGRGVRASDTVLEGQEVLRVPLNSVICAKTVQHASKGGARLASSFSTKTDKVVAAFLLLEKAKGEDSLWASYLRVLPEFVPSAWLAPPEILKELHDEHLEGRLRNFRRILDAEHSQLVKTLALALKEDNVPAEAHTDALSLNAFYWATAIVDSRAITISGQKYLVPFVDMFNYKAHMRPRQHANGDFFEAHHKLERNDFVVFADRNVQAGQQVFMDYGDNPSEVYLTYHGFVPDHNPFDCAIVAASLPASLEAGEAGEQRSRLLNTLRIGTTVRECLRWNTVDRTWAQSKLAILDRVAQLSDEDVAACVKDLDAASGQNEISQIARKCLAGTQERRSTLVDHVKAAQPSYPLEEDIAKLSAAIEADDTFAALILSHRVAQRTALSHLLGFLENKVMPPHPIVPSLEEAAASLKDYGLPPADYLANEPPLETQVARLNSWVKEQAFPVVKVEAATVPHLRVGTIVTEDLAAEDPYLIIPKDLVMDVRTATESKVYPFIFHLCENLGIPDPFHELMIFLMFEYFVEGPRSVWWPYLSLLPRPDEFMAPSFFSEEDLAILEGHQTQSEAIKNRDQVRARFGRVKPFLESEGVLSFLPASVFTVENYFWAHAILDSRGIWWQGQRHLVPLLDMVNCKAGGARPHETFVNTTLASAVTRAPQMYKAGDQLFEDYGQPNHIYFLYHGFSLENNAYDCFRVTIDLNERQRKALANFEFGGNMRRVRAEKHPFCVHAPLRGAANQGLTAALGTSSASLSPVTDQIKEALSAMPTTLEEDERKLAEASTHGLSDRAQSALLFIIREKRLLHALLEDA